MPGFLNNSVRVYPVKLKVGMLDHMNNTFRNTVFRYLSMCLYCCAVIFSLFSYCCSYFFFFFFLCFSFTCSFDNILCVSFRFLHFLNINKDHFPPNIENLKCFFIHHHYFKSIRNVYYTKSDVINPFMTEAVII